MDLQVRLKVPEHPFLDHDSFVDCSNPRREFLRERLLSAVTNDMKAYQGAVSGHAISDILDAVSRAKTIEPHVKQIILASLRKRG